MKCLIYEVLPFQGIYLEGMHCNNTRLVTSENDYIYIYIAPKLPVAKMCINIIDRWTNTIALTHSAHACCSE